MFTITKKFNFDSSHRLWDKNLDSEENYEIFGKCANSPSHGHTYTLIIYIKGNKLNNNMLINFRDISKTVKPLINKLDHRFLNDLFPLNNPDKDFVTTSENMAKEIFIYLKDKLQGLHKIRLSETQNTYAEYENA